MVRSTLFVALALALPGFSAAQTATHTVVPGNTLWGLAQQYYGNPYLWPRIHQANAGTVENPHRIMPGWVLTIPSADAQVTVVEVQVEPGPGGDLPPAPMPAAPAVDAPAAAAFVDPQERPRTVFYRERTLEVSDVTATRGLWDVPPDEFYSAPWLIPPATMPDRTGEVAGLTLGEDLSAPRTSMRVFDRVRIRTEGAPPAPGTRLQAFRVEREVEEVGQVVRPTAVLLVEAVTGEGVEAVVESQYGRLLAGDLVRPLPPYTPLPVDVTIPAGTGADAILLGFATDQEIHALGDHAFFDRGADQGVRIGDEYVLVIDETPEWGASVQGRLKVVSVLANVATARIVGVENPVFVPGVRLRPDRRVP